LLVVEVVQEVLVEQVEVEALLLVLQILEAAVVVIMLTAVQV
jgi:hypothetical protein